MTVELPGLSSDGNANLAPERSRSNESPAVLWALAAATTLTEAEGVQIPAGFHKRPHAIDARKRIAFRTALLVMVLSRFNGKAANLENVQLFIWASRTSRTRAMLMAWWAGRRFASTQLQRADPDLQVTARLAIVDGLVGVKGQGSRRLYLTEKGVALAEALDRESEVLSIEKRFLASFSRLSDAAVARHLGVDVE
jgi:hypothetical protein